MRMVDAEACGRVPAASAAVTPTSYAEPSRAASVLAMILLALSR